MSTLTVGQGAQYPTISSAVAAASSGDTIDVQAGTYTNDFPTVGQNLTLQAVGGTVTMAATQSPPNGTRLAAALDASLRRITVQYEEPCRGRDGQR